MTHYLFILGRNPELSLLEILAYCRRKNIACKLAEYNEEIALVEMNAFDDQQAIKDLGGTVKIARPLEDENMVYQGTKNKIVYAVNYYKSDPQQVDKQIKRLLAQEELKATRRHGKSRVIDPSKAKNLDIEFVVYYNKLFLTSAISNPKAYKQRDANRPCYDPLKVISIRLAKILINLSEAKREILDPFCGYGTILQEALLMNLLVMGVDKEDQYARKNLQWLEQHYPAVKGKWQVFKGDATNLQKFKAIEAVVTEPYLGPFYRSYPSKVEAHSIAKELHTLYKKTLQELHRIVQGKVVIIFPELKTREKETIPLDISSVLQQTKFKTVSPLPAINMPLPYFDKKDKINRYIYILEKKKI